ncbi:hypothetical protein [Actinophytocola oryzae]|uniref:Uncharacterized protein n=1 Tax=Actinophytocola oryzae TaxID=502181 RepID=A0A4R7W3P3_9PSEU|nr:hypothetical protein [Actinophytocola oryzae]TDV57266.1 hypothetical protein CLV71_101137 [Actinophytocola oryzae]
MTDRVQKRKRKLSPDSSRKKAREGVDSPERNSSDDEGTTTALALRTRAELKSEVEPKSNLDVEFSLDDNSDIGAPRQVTTTTVPKPAVKAVTTKPANPFVGQVAALRGNFPSGYHDTAHFAPTTKKPKHGVWGKKGSKPLRKWVKLALDSINANDDFVVDSKRGEKGGWIYLVSMDGETVGYLSGSKAPPGNPPAKYIEIFLDAKKNTVSAFPSDPSMF